MLARWQRRLCQQHLAYLPLRPAPVAEPNVGLMALTVSSSVGGDRLQTLQNRRPPFHRVTAAGILQGKPPEHHGHLSTSQVHLNRSA